ncbi:MAG: GAF domain-containing protein [Bacteroidales bacterium]|nr:GAF domain-containing protein [Bacteroidales bacterium]
MENFKVTSSTKEEIYKEIIPQIEAILNGETDLIANTSNFCAMLKEAFDFWWVGFYFVKQTRDSQQLVLGPFQGPLACTRINYGKGVCGTAWKQKQTIIVPNVDEFPGHIACSSLSKSEIVVPVIRNGEVVAVLDIDSKELNTFSFTDKEYLEDILGKINFDF